MRELGLYYRGYEQLMEHWRAVLPAGQSAVGLLADLWDHPEDRDVWRRVMELVPPYRLEQLLDRTPEAKGEILAIVGRADYHPDWVLDALLQLAVRPENAKAIERILTRRLDLFAYLEDGPGDPRFFLLEELLGLL